MLTLPPSPFNHPIQMRELQLRPPLTMRPPTTKTLLLLLLFLLPTPTTRSATFTFENRCTFTVWPGLLSNSGSPPAPTTGFDLPSLSSLSFEFPSSWSGRLWGRTGCTFLPNTNVFSCSTADCGTGTLPCSGAGAKPPATLAEFTLSPSSMDFYDVSLVDGYNLPLVITPLSPSCVATGCPADLNRGCPAELRAPGGEGCMSACEAFGKDEYCCSGGHGNPDTCGPSVYSELFKSACPRSYSYAFDDATSTFTCQGGGHYVLSFCPSSSTPSSSQKSSRGKSLQDLQPKRTTDGNQPLVSENEAWFASLATGSAIGGRDQIHGSFSYLLAITAATSCSLVCSLMLPR